MSCDENSNSWDKLRSSETNLSRHQRGRESILRFVICRFRPVEQLRLRVCWRLIPILELKYYRSDGVWFFVEAGLYCEIERIVCKQHAVLRHYLFHSCHSAIQILGYTHSTLNIYKVLLCWSDWLRANKWLAIQKFTMQTRHKKLTNSILFLVFNCHLSAR
jgi:hypothetical protein